MSVHPPNHEIRLPSSERRARMAAFVAEKGAAVSDELAKVFGVSMMTVWRDLTLLEEGGQVRKVRGGATRVERRSETEPFYVSKQVLNRELKHRIARYAAEHLVHDGDALFMEAGTTVAAMARYLSTYHRLTIIGNGLGTMNELAKHVREMSVYCCGGMLREVALTFVGPQAEQFFDHVNAQTCFLSGTGITIADGITDVSLLEIQVKRAMAAAAHEVVFLMDSTKFGVRSFARILGYESITTIVTDDGAPMEAVEQLRNAGIVVHVVS